MGRGWLLAGLGCLMAGAEARPITVCIDPGHPSEVGRGTTGKKISEIRAAWLVAGQLKNKLEAAGVRVVMTKSREEQYVENVRRAEIANTANADFMVRLHCDAASGRGFTTYFPDRAGTAHGKTGPSNEVIRQSAAMAKTFHAALVLGLKGKLRDNGLLPDIRTAVGSKQGALTGSIFSKVPVVLVEMVVLTNPKDEAFILRPEGQDAMAAALANATLAALKAPAATRGTSPAGSRP